MITVYSNENKLKPEIISEDNKGAIVRALWIDLLNPSLTEEKWVEDITGLDIPTREDMQEIELSSRLYKDRGAFFMTVTMVVKSDSSQPSSDAVALILTESTFITVRYVEPYSFSAFISRIMKLAPSDYTAVNLFVELLDASIDRLADILEKVSHGLDRYSQEIFHSQYNDGSSDAPDYKSHLQVLAANGDLTTKVQESLITFNRLITFYAQSGLPVSDAMIKARLTILSKDVDSLKDYVTFLSTKVNFLLDATLGLINIQQNNIIKIFSIAAVILLPPTLVASIYGMNFHHMPELSFKLGYPLAILLMVLAGWLPYKFFKMKKWL